MYRGSVALSLPIPRVTPSGSHGTVRSLVLFRFFPLDDPGFTQAHVRPSRPSSHFSSLPTWYKQKCPPQSYSASGYALLCALFEFDPERRITARQALASPWFTEDSPRPSLKFVLVFFYSRQCPCPPLNYPPLTLLISSLPRSSRPSPSFSCVPRPQRIHQHPAHLSRPPRYQR